MSAELTIKQLQEIGFSNNWFALCSGTMQNHYDDVVERLERLQKEDEALKDFIDKLLKELGEKE